MKNLPKNNWCSHKEILDVRWNNWFDPAAETLGCRHDQKFLALLSKDQYIHVEYHHILQKIMLILQNKGGSITFRLDTVLNRHRAKHLQKRPGQLFTC